MVRDLLSRISIVLLTILIVCVIYFIVILHLEKDNQSSENGTVCNTAASVTDKGEFNGK